jgi:hypothetical protein
VAAPDSVRSTDRDPAFRDLKLLVQPTAATFVLPRDIYCGVFVTPAAACDPLRGLTIELLTRPRALILQPGRRTSDNAPDVSDLHYTSLH